MKMIISLFLAVTLMAGMMLSPSFAFSESENDKASISSLSDVQRNSVGILNYLAYLTQEITAQKGNKLYLEDAYSALYNNTYLSSIDEATLGMIKSMLTALHNFQMIATKRERLEYIYEQNQAQAIRNAIPNPLSVMNVIMSGSWQKALVSVVYMAVDSVNSYTSSKLAADNQFLQDNWELDDEEKEVLHNGHLESLQYAWEIVHDYGFDSKLALYEDDINRFVEWKNKKNLDARIQFLESNRAVFQAFGEYWLMLAESYYDYGNMEKCLNAVQSYEDFGTRIFNKDYHYAKVLPLAIAAAASVYDNDRYVTDASRYASLILANCDQEDWVLRYYAAQTFVDLAGRTGEKAYLQKAYDIVLDNVNHLAGQQKKNNKVYLADVELEKLPDPSSKTKISEALTKKKKDEIEKYNNGLKETRKTALPPVSDALVLNCDLLFSLIQQVEADTKRVNGILYGDGEPLFLNPVMDALYHEVEEQNTEQIVSQVTFSGKEMKIPAYLLTEKSTVSLGVIDSNGKITIVDDWTIKSVERKNTADVSSFIATLSSKSVPDFEKGSSAWISINPYGDEHTQEIQVTFTIEGNNSIVVPVILTVLFFHII